MSPTGSISGLRPVTSSNWLSRFEANCKSNLLGELFSVMEAKEILRIAVGVTPVRLQALEPTSLLEESLIMEDPALSVLTETGWNFRAGRLLPASLKFWEDTLSAQRGG